MRVIAVIDHSQAVEKTLRDLGAWHDPPPGRFRALYLRTVWDADPMPDLSTARSFYLPIAHALIDFYL
jgi:hypothetical protein